MEYRESIIRRKIKEYPISANIMKEMRSKKEKVKSFPSYSLCSSLTINILLEKERNDNIIKMESKMRNRGSIESIKLKKGICHFCHMNKF